MCRRHAMAPKEPYALSPVQIAERAMPSVVLIQVSQGFGTGFAVARGGCIATNLHVIAGAQTATVVLADGRQFGEVEILAVDEDQDLALLRIPELELPALPLGTSATVRPGEHVIAIGNPLGLGHTVSDGLVSAVREVTPAISLLQISTPLAPGSSGGPLLNDQGEVIGISRLIQARGQNLNFAVPVDALKPLLDVSQGTPLHEWSWGGRIEREVPHHDTDLLEDCTPDDLGVIVERIEHAISIGAPLYNDGKPEACFRIYQAMALDLDRTLIGCAGVKEALLAGVRRCEQLAGEDEKAWAMRDTFDGLLEVVERQVDALRDQESSSHLPRVPARAVPHHLLSLLDGCAPQSIHRIANAIADAIAVGAPLYNDGHFEACFRIYEGAVLDLERKLAGCDGPRRALAQGLGEAERRSSYSDKAWALRDAFDGLLDVIGRLPSTKN